MFSRSSYSSLQIKDSTALWLGIGFSFLFTALIYVMSTFFLQRPNLLPDTGAEWYYWKLPPDQVTFITRLSVWGLYIAHQLFSWTTILYAQKYVKKYSSNLHTINIVALGGNALFIFLHVLQTYFFYDGLAQDVSIFSSQFSVIFLLVFILIMENPRRGMFFGKKIPVKKRITKVIRKYHGYYFSWAIVYTFWFHPAEYTWGHLIGFLYMFLLILQGSLFFTRIHINKYWTIIQELTVLIHGTIVALIQANGIWPMFFFGFFGMIIITQLWGLDLNKKLNALVISIYIIGVGIVYSGIFIENMGPSKIWQLIAIPMIEYGFAILFIGLMYLIFILLNIFKTELKENTLP